MKWFRVRIQKPAGVVLVATMNGVSRSSILLGRAVATIKGDDGIVLSVESIEAPKIVFPS
jgi:hypothetical protein